MNYVFYSNQFLLLQQPFHQRLDLLEEGATYPYGNTSVIYDHGRISFHAAPETLSVTYTVAEEHMTARKTKLKTAKKRAAEAKGVV